MLVRSGRTRPRDSRPRDRPPPDRPPRDSPRRPAMTNGRARELDARGSWGHWVVLALVLAGLAGALVIRREMAIGPPPADSAAPAEVTLAGPVLAPRRGEPATAAVRPGTISLIFDGGPGRDFTPRIVAMLGRLGIPATFFVTGHQVADVGVIGRERDERDDIGMTGYTGERMATMPTWWLKAELAETQHALLRAGEPATALVRPPGATTVSALTTGTWTAARRLAGLGYVVVLADRSAQAAVSPAAVLRAMLPDEVGSTQAALTGDTAARPPGLVLALSDTGRPGAAALGALPRLATALRSDGYRFTTVSRACDLAVGSLRIPAIAAAGQQALLVAGRAATIVTSAVGWAFLLAVILVGSRILLLVVTGGWHRWRDRQAPRPWFGPVSVVIPAYNERAGIERCLRSMADSHYPDLEIIMVDDGSTDGTAEVARGLGLPVTVVTQANSGKAAALSTGVSRAHHDVLVFADGDTVFEPDTIARLVAPMCDPWVGAVAGNVKVANRRGLLGRIQHAEYVLASSLDRRMYDVLDCMVTVPGAVGAFRRAAITGAGGVPTHTLAEDTDLTIAIGRAGWRVRYAARAVAWTEAPATLRQLWSQRHRWAYGMLQVLWKYRGIVAAPQGKRTLAWIGLPYLFAMGCILPLVSPAADLYVLLDIWISPWHAVEIWTGFLVMQAALTLCAFAFDGESMRDLWTLPLQLVFYRQLMYLVVIHSIATALTGVRLRWHKLARIGIGMREA